jgi:transcriptional regulator with XRE-family HTH domain
VAVKTLKFIARSEALKSARQSKKMSQAELAGMIGTSEALYNKVEAGHTMVQLDRARLIAALVGSEPAKMFKPADPAIKWGSDL